MTHTLDVICGVLFLQDLCDLYKIIKRDNARTDLVDVIPEEQQSCLSLCRSELLLHQLVHVEQVIQHLR